MRSKVRVTADLPNKFTTLGAFIFNKKVVDPAVEQENVDLRKELQTEVNYVPFVLVHLIYMI